MNRPNFSFLFCIDEISKDGSIKQKKIILILKIDKLFIALQSKCEIVLDYGMV